MKGPVHISVTLRELVARGVLPPPHGKRWPVLVRFPAAQVDPPLPAEVRHGLSQTPADVPAERGTKAT